jgi:hypothetical protein
MSTLLTKPLMYTFTIQITAPLILLILSTLNGNIYGTDVINKSIYYNILKKCVMYYYILYAIFAIIPLVFPKKYSNVILKILDILCLLLLIYIGLLSTVLIPTEIYEMVKYKPILSIFIDIACRIYWIIITILFLINLSIIGESKPIIV